MPARRRSVAVWPAIRVIQEAVCDCSGVALREMLSPRREKRVVQARQAAFWLARQAGHSFPAIGRAFGDRDHTTVMYGVSRVEQLLIEDADYAAAVARAAAAAGCPAPSDLAAAAAS